MSRSDSAGRGGRRRASRGRRHRDAAPAAGVAYQDDEERAYGADAYGADAYGEQPYPDDSYASSPADAPYDDGPYADEPEEDGAPAEEAPLSKAERRAEKKRRKRAEKRGKSAGGSPRRGRRAAAAPAPADPVSRFSASALRKVSVLGDRPNQVVNNLAEQSVRKRGTVVLGVLLGLFGLALVALLGLLAYLLVSDAPIGGSGDEPRLEMPEDGHSTLLPTVFQGSTEEQEIFDPIATRGEDAPPLDAEKVFGSDVEKLKKDDFTFVLEGSEATDTCTQWVWGEDLGQSLVDAGCTSAARGVYQDEDGDYVAQFTLFDLADADSSAAVAETLDPRNLESDPGFLVPMQEDTKGLHEGYSQASVQVMGHYLAVFWVARTNGEEPDKDTSMATAGVVAMDAAVWVYEEVSRAKDDGGE
ncbi:hypothetical protein [Nocardiopsis composta]|uniref:Uncharacterized protein n=1 Tax=Nocardiopsis composta TaxID=157465 RepID=A0A7W8VGS4_9ACTN|nr:hypothetical protein [Nocardiopsis composta]MBB5435852.1 hypothetical protein [Nocardiopsis composta]